MRIVLKVCVLNDNHVACGVPQPGGDGDSLAPVLRGVSGFTLLAGIKRRFGPLKRDYKAFWHIQKYYGGQFYSAAQPGVSNSGGSPDFKTELLRSPPVFGIFN